MQNVNYEIKENAKSNNEEPVNIELLMAEVTAKHLELEVSENCDMLCAYSLDYSTNYNVKQLGLIMDYYKLPKRKMKKNDIMKTIVDFESKPENNHLVMMRKRLWQNLIELKNDEFFAKHIIIEI